MSSKLSTEILINLTGNLTSKARQYGANMSEFARRNERAMSVVKATSAAAGRGLDALGNRYTGMIAGFAGGAMLREFAKTDRTLTELGIAAGKTRDEMRQIFSDTQDTAIKFRVDDSELVRALATYNKMTGNLDVGAKSKDIMAATMAASGADGESVGGLFASIQKFKTKSDKENLQAADYLNQLGKEGGFELKDFATSAVKVFSAYAGTGRTGPKAAKEIGVVLESSMDAVGDKDLAATAASNLLNDLRNPKIAKILEGSGVQLRDNSGNMLAINDIIKDIAERSGKGGSKRQDERLAKAGFTDYSRLIISNVTTGEGAENFARYNSVVADGSGIMTDAKYAAQDFTSAMQTLNTTWEKFTNNNLAKPVQELADAINSVDQKTTQNWLETGKQITVVVGGIIAARKAFQLGKGAMGLFGVGKGKGIPKGVSDVFGSGVMPVYVVNMGSGLGAGGPGGPTPPVPGQTPPKPGGGPSIPPATSLTGLAFRALTGAGMVYAQTEVADYFAKNIYEGSGLGELARQSPTRAWSESVATQLSPTNVDKSSVWDEIADFFTSTANNPQITNPTPWASLQPQNQTQTYPAFSLQPLTGEIRVVIEGDARVKNVKMNQPGITLSAQSGVSNVEQN